MKKIVLVILMVMIPVLGIAQTLGGNESYGNNFGFLKTVGGAVINGKAYVVGTNDITQTFAPRSWAGLFVNVQSKDSASIHIKYQISNDGVTYGVLTTLDSLSTASDSGDVKTVNLSSILGAYSARLVLTVTGYQCGVSTATYSAVLVQKKY